MLRLNQLIGFGQSQMRFSPSYSVTSSEDNATAILSPTALIGDILVLIDSATNSGAYPTEVIPSGFTKTGATLDTDMGKSNTWRYTRTVFSQKIITSSGQQSVTGMSGNTARKIAVLVRGSAAAAGLMMLNGSDYQNDFNGGTISNSLANMPYGLFLSHQRSYDIPSSQSETPNMTSMPTSASWQFAHHRAGSGSQSTSITYSATSAYVQATLLHLSMPV